LKVKRQKNYLVDSTNREKDEDLTNLTFVNHKFNKQKQISFT